MVDYMVLGQVFLRVLGLFCQYHSANCPYSFVNLHYTGHFIMFSMITNIYNKKTKGPTLMELFTASQPQENWKSFFWQLEMFNVYMMGDMAHIDMIFKFLPHTHQHGCFLLAQTPISVNCMYHAQMVLAVGKSFAYFAWNARCTVITDLLVCDIPTHKMLSPPEWAFSHYIHSHHLLAEICTTIKNNLLGKNFWVVPSVCTVFVNTCPTVFL